MDILENCSKMKVLKIRILKNCLRMEFNIYIFEIRIA